MGIDDVDRMFRSRAATIKREQPAPGDLCAHPACGGRLGYPLTMDAIYGGRPVGQLACVTCHKEPRETDRVRT